MRLKKNQLVMIQKVKEAELQVNKRKIRIKTLVKLKAVLVRSQIRALVVWLNL